MADYLTVFGKLREEYDAVVHFCISSEMSCCYQNACVAAAEIGGVYPVDSRNLSTGIGLLILEAAEMAAKGEMTGASSAQNPSRTTRPTPRRRSAPTAASIFSLSSPFLAQ